MDDFYKEYLQSALWHHKREQKLEEVGYKCETCANTMNDCILQVHHLTYARLGNELMSDLQVACIFCHPTQDQIRRIAARKRRFQERLESAPAWYAGLLSSLAEARARGLPEVDPRCYRDVLGQTIRRYSKEDMDQLFFWIDLLVESAGKAGDRGVRTVACKAAESLRQIRLKLEEL